jgi:hypothetical protein
MRPLILCVALILCASTIQAEIYTWVDTDGTRHFSDIRPTHGERYEEKNKRDLVERNVVQGLRTAAPPKETPPERPGGNPSTYAANEHENEDDGGSLLEYRCENYLRNINQIQKKLRRSHTAEDGERWRKERKHWSHKRYDECF